MKRIRAAVLSILIASFSVLAIPVAAQQVIATVPVGDQPGRVAVNSTTNKIYVTNVCGNDLTCPYPYPQGTVTVIDGATEQTVSVNVGYFPFGAAVNPVTNRIYVANECGNDPNCLSNGTVSVIDGVSNTVIATVNVGNVPYSFAVNSVTNKIYVVNGCGDPSCISSSGTVSVIDGVSNTVTALVPVGSDPDPPVLNPVTNKIYVANACGNDPTCNQPYVNGTVTVIDGVTNNTQSVNVGYIPFSLDVNSATNKIYVANACGDNPNCGLVTPTITAIDGATLGTTEVSIGGYGAPAIAVSSATNKIYVPSQCKGDPSCQGDPLGTVSVVDGETLTYTSVPTGSNPVALAIDLVGNKVYVANQCGTDATCQTHTVRECSSQWTVG
jgi:YVTN family beta-propeller protein